MRFDMSDELPGQMSVNSIIYNDEDNVPMNGHDVDGMRYLYMAKDSFDGPHNPTVYSSRAEMKAVEDQIPFDDPPRDGCWNCLNYNYDHEACTIGWNNMDEDYYNPASDDRNPTDYCEYHELDKDAVWEDWFDD